MAPLLLREIIAAKRSEWMQESVTFCVSIQTRAGSHFSYLGDRMRSILNLGPFDKETGHVNAIIDTPKGSRNKFKFDERLGLFRLGGALPLGSVFPFDFGYVPSTQGGDGDPLDVLILMDEPAFTGCLVAAKLIGVIEANQTEDGVTTRNDRLIAVAADSRNHSHIRFLGDLNTNLIHEIEQFFVSYNHTKGKRFELLGRFGPDRATKLINHAHKKFRATSSTDYSEDSR